MTPAVVLTNSSNPFVFIAREIAIHVCIIPYTYTCMHVNTHTPTHVMYLTKQRNLTQMKINIISAKAEVRVLLQIILAEPDVSIIMSPVVLF
jgi:hypothetical protein